MRFSTHPLAGDQVAKAFPAAKPDPAVAGRLAESLAGMVADSDALANTFYKLLFDRHPGLRPLFPDDMALQQAKLVATLQWVVARLARPAEVRPVVAALGRRHRDVGVAAAHYPLVAAALVEAMAKVSGPQWTDRLRAEWTTAIELMAGQMLAGAGEAAGDAADPRESPARPSYDSVRVPPHRE